jgi:peptidoglycan hydrolase CwlO-like protein
MGLLHRLRIICVLTLGLGIFWLASTPAQAVTTTSMTLPGMLTTTTEFTLSEGVQTQVDALTAQAQAVQAGLDALDTQLDQKIQDYYKCMDDLDAASARLSELRRMVADAQTKKAQAQALLAQRVKSVYMAGGRDQLLQMLLTADSLDDLYNRLHLVSTLTDQDNQIISDLKSSSTRLDLLMKATDGQRRDQMSLERQLSRQTDDLKGIMAQRQQTLAGLDAQVKTIIEEERQRKLAEQARIQAELTAKFLAEQQAAALAAAQNQLLAGTQSRGANVLGAVQIAQAAEKAGFKGQNLEIAVAVALAESGGNVNAKGDVTIGGSFGLWQVYCMAHPDLIPPSNPDSVAWYDPDQNARWAYQISGGSNWKPWSTYKHGTYAAFMDVARAAVLQLITGTSTVAQAG